MNAQFTSKDQNWQDGATTYWFELDGKDPGTGKTFERAKFGVVEQGPDSTIVDAEGCPITAGDGLHVAVSRYAIVTDAMRAD